MLVCRRTARLESRSALETSIIWTGMSWESKLRLDGNDEGVHTCPNSILRGSNLPLLPGRGQSEGMMCETVGMQTCGPVSSE